MRRRPFKPAADSLNQGASTSFDNSPSVELSSSEELLNDFDEYTEGQERLPSLEGEDKRKMLLWLGEKAYCISNECPVEDRMRWLEAAYSNLKEAYAMNETDPECLRTLAAATGRLAEESSLLRKITLGFEFKKYLDAAIEADNEEDPDSSFELYHMRERFAYSVLSMSMTERALARVTGAVPSFTVEGAVADFKKAQELGHDSSENELFLAKSLILKGDKEEAKQWLTKACDVEADSVIEQEYITEARQLLSPTGIIASIEVGDLLNAERSPLEEEEALRLAKMNVVVPQK